MTVAATTFNVAYPSGISAGDLLVLHIATNGGAVTSPSGWTVIHNDTTLSNPKGGMWIKVADGSESGTLAVTTASTTGSASMLRYTGVDQTTPQDTTATTVSTSALTHIVIPTLTTVTNDTMLVYGGAANSSSVTCTGPGGSTERKDYEQESATSPKSGAIYDEAFPTAGSTGSRTITLSATRANWGAMMALRPASLGSLLLPNRNPLIVRR